MGERASRELDTRGLGRETAVQHALFALSRGREQRLGCAGSLNVKGGPTLVGDPLTMTQHLSAAWGR